MHRLGTLVATLAAAAILAPATGFAQEAIGEITYLEGSVRLMQNGLWSVAQMRQHVYADQTVETGNDGSVEIRWSNATKTVIEGSRRQELKSLFAASTRSAPSGSASFWSSFKTLFKKGSERQQEGGIRRDQAEVKDSGKGEMYFKEDQEVSFEAASSFYENQEYAKAAHAFRMFLEQHPRDSRARLALFALGHCYLEMNDQPSAKSTLQEFVAKYPDDELVTESRSLLSKF